MDKKEKTQGNPEMKDFSNYYNQGNDCDCCGNRYSWGRDGDASGCSCFDAGEGCSFMEDREHESLVDKGRVTENMKSLLHYPGSKKRIAPWVIKNMPPHHSYLEPYFGGGAVLFEKPPSKIETVNDLDRDVVNFFQVIKDPGRREELTEWLDYTPYSRQVYDESFVAGQKTSVEQAGYFAVRSMQSHGFRLTEKCGWKKDVHGRGAAYAVRYWNELPGVLAGMATRLKEVQIENKPAIELIRAFNYENVLMYLDPPYVLSTRGGKTIPARDVRPGTWGTACRGSTEQGDDNAGRV